MHSLLISRIRWINSRWGIRTQGLSGCSLDKIAEEYAGKLVVSKVNTDQDAKWATQYGVSGIPTSRAAADIDHHRVLLHDSEFGVCN